MRAPTSQPYVLLAACGVVLSACLDVTPYPTIDSGGATDATVIDATVTDATVTDAADATSAPVEATTHHPDGGPG